MIPILAPLLVGDLAPYRDALMLADDPRPSRPIREWLAPAAFAGVLQAYGAPRTQDAQRGLASEWSKDYLRRLLPPVIAATLVLGHRLPLSLDTLELSLDDAGRPQAFRLPDAGSAWAPARVGPAEDPFRRFAPLIDDHLQPLVDALADHSRLSPRVYWSNAANYVEWLVTAIAAKVPAAMVADARAMLELRYRLDGRDNPFYRPVRYVDEGVGATAGPRRRRRVCCVRYLVPGTELCTNCPLTTMPGGSGDPAPPAGDQFT
jgi:ferric iron reductase protein FhuF